MLRPLDVIVAAILLARPDIAEDEAVRHAKVLREVAREHAFDPLTGVAIIRHESGWQSQTISANGEDYGLAQIRARYIGACRNDADPLRHPSKECQAVKRSLLDAETNIRTMGKLIGSTASCAVRKPAANPCTAGSRATRVATTRNASAGASPAPRPGRSSATAPGWSAKYAENARAGLVADRRGALASLGPARAEAGSTAGETGSAASD